MRTFAYITKINKMLPGVLQAKWTEEKIQLNQHKETLLIGLQMSTRGNYLTSIL